jgi:hypothetical protein
MIRTEAECRYAIKKVDTLLDIRDSGKGNGTEDSEIAELTEKIREYEDWAYGDEFGEVFGGTGFGWREE